MQNNAKAMPMFGAPFWGTGVGIEHSKLLLNKHNFRTSPTGQSAGGQQRDCQTKGLFRIPQSVIDSKLAILIYCHYSYIQPCVVIL